MSYALYAFAAAAGYFIYTQVMRPPAPQMQAEQLKVALKPQPRILYKPLARLLLQNKPSVSVGPKSRDQGWLGTPRMDLVDKQTGQITPIYSTEPQNTMSVLQI